MSVRNFIHPAIAISLRVGGLTFFFVRLRAFVCGVVVTPGAGVEGAQTCSGTMHGIKRAPS